MAWVDAVHLRAGTGLLLGVLATSCHPGRATFPWASATSPPLAAEHAEVRTLNPTYDRLRSHVLIREIDRPSRAALDYAAYHANFMLADPEPEQLAANAAGPSSDQPFAALVVASTLTGDIARTPLSAQERRHPLAFAPLVEFLLARRTPGGDALAQLGSAVRDETWGQPATPGVSFQAIAEVFLHRVAPASGELWVKIEFAPWFQALGPLPDQDGDGFPEVYARARADRMRPEIADAVEREYVGRVLAPAEVKAWANQLSSYWYPSFNTDLAAAGARWPDAATEAEIKRELDGREFSTPTIVLRGKPQGLATYNVFLVKAPDGQAAPPQPAAATEGVALELGKTRPTAEWQAIAEVVRRELTAHGQGSWETWAAQLAPFHATIRRRLAATPPKIKALAGVNGFLFFRDSLEYVAGGDLEQQPPGRNPLPIIVEFKQQLEALGVDFLFVPVPSKLELFPDALDPKFAGLVGQIVNPFERKFVLRLAENGVEVVDLLAPLLAARAAGDGAGQEPLYQPQDTHWTDRGLRLAADLLAARIKRYPWYGELARHAQSFTTREASFTRFGDLHSRLPEPLKRKYRPQTLVAQQVLRTDGSPYEDDPDSPVVVLGDSFTGVYELTDAEHAGLSAHVARGISYPVDLVMSYGGGPNVRSKLMRRGTAALATKKLVIWVMAARDLYDYWEDWKSSRGP